MRIAWLLVGCALAPPRPPQPDPNGPAIQETVTHVGKHSRTHIWKCGHEIEANNLDRVGVAMADDPQQQRRRVWSERETAAGSMLILVGIVASAVGAGLAAVGDWRAGLGAITGGAAANGIGWPIAIDGLKREDAAVREYNQRHDCH
jgi:hypothetical protein